MVILNTYAAECSDGTFDGTEGSVERLSGQTFTNGGFTMAEATPDVEQLISDYLDVWNGDYATLPDVVTESVAIYGPAAPEGGIHGRDEFEAYLEELRTGFPDVTLTEDDLLAGDDVVMAEWTFTGTHEGEFNEIPPTGREVEITGMSKILLADDKVREDRIYYDLQELFEQLGLTEE